MFQQVPVYNAALESENRILNTDHIESVAPHANVPVDPGAADTACVEIIFHSGTSWVVLLDYASAYTHLQTLEGEITTLGVLS